MTVIETDRLTITLSTREQMEALIDGEPDEEMKTAYGEMLDGCLRCPEQWEWYAVWMIDRKDGVHVGDLCFKGLNPDGSVEIGYGVAEEQQNRGYASEAVAAAAAWALSRPGVKCVEAETAPDNLASRRVLEKCGFLPTGVMGEEGPRFRLNQK